jgi:hypothetical protein
VFHTVPKYDTVSKLKSSRTKIWQSSFGFSEQWSQKFASLSHSSFSTLNARITNKSTDYGPRGYKAHLLEKPALRTSFRLLLFSPHLSSDRIKQSFSYDFFFNKFEKICLQRVRPLISLHRTDIKYAITNFQFPFIYDFTNSDYRYRRNQIRYQLIPFIRYLFGSSFDQNFYRFMQLSQKEQLILETLEQKICFDLYQKLFDDISYTAIPVQLQMHLLYRVICLYTNRANSTKFMEQMIKEL